MAKTPDSILLTTQEAAEVAGVSQRTIQKWIRQGSLIAIQRVPKLLVARADLELFLHNRHQPVPPTPARPQGQSFTISDAARLCGVSRTTLQRAVRTGRLRLNADHRLERGELIHAGYLSLGSQDPDEILEQPGGKSTNRLDQLSAQMDDLLKQHREMGAELKRIQQDLQVFKAPKSRPKQARQEILAYMKRNPGPHSIREIQAGLGWTHTPRHMLRSLATEGLLHRRNRGIYEHPLVN